MAGRAAADPATKTRRVVLGGIALGTAVLILSIWDGARPHLGSLPAPLDLFMGTIMLWFLLMAGGMALVVLIAAFGRALAQAAVEVLEYLARAAGRATTTLYERIRHWAEPRWQARPHPRLNDAQRERDRNGQQDICAACGRAGTGDDPLVIRKGYRVHRSHTADPGDGFHEPLSGNGDTRLQVAEPGTMTLDGHDNDVTLHNWRFIDPLNPTEPARPATEEDMARLIRDYTVPELHEMSHGKGCTCPISRLTGHARTSSITPQPQQKAGNAMTRTSTRRVPAYWNSAANTTADFHPDSDAELLEWMSGETAGILAYGEAVAELHEHCVTAIRADPAAMAALHDVAEAAAEFAEAMARAREKFTQVYEAPREFVSDGGTLPKDGDWLHGEDGA